MVEALIEPLHSADAMTRARAEAALEEQGEAAVPPLLAALADEADRARASAARVLGRISSHRAVVPLLRASTSCSAQPGGAGAPRLTRSRAVVPRAGPGPEA